MQRIIDAALGIHKAEYVIKNAKVVDVFCGRIIEGDVAICDGKIASIGTSNLDYRSLYHHFENNVLLYGCEAVEKMAEDFEITFIAPSKSSITMYASANARYASTHFGSILIASS